MKRAKQLLAELDTAFSADHYAADEILQQLQSLYANSKNKWIKAQIQLRKLTLGEALKRNTEEELFNPELLAYFEENGLRYEAAALLMSRINFLHNKGESALAEELLLEMQDNNLVEVSPLITFAYYTQWLNIHLRKNEHAQRLMVCLEALEKLERMSNRNSEWYRFYLVFAGDIIATYAANEEYEKAFPYINPGVHIAEEQTVSLSIKSAFWRDIASYYAAINDHENTVKCYMHTVNLLRNKEAYIFHLLGAYNSLAQQYFLWYQDTPVSEKKKRAELFHEMEKYVLATENYSDKEKFPILKIFHPVNVGRWELLRKNYAKAAKTLTEALQQTHANHRVLLTNYRLLHTVYYEWWLETKNAQKLQFAYDFSQKAQKMVEADAIQKTQKKLDTIRIHHELEEQKLTQQLLQQQIEAMNKEHQLTTLNLHEKVMVLDELKAYVRSLKKKELEARQLINAIDKKIEAVKITEHDKATLQQKLDESNKHLSKALSEKYPALSTLEIQMCTLFQTGITNKELAKLYGQTEEAYKKHRYRIKQKMKLSINDDLVKHILSLTGQH